MLTGYAIGAGIAVVAWLSLSVAAGQFRYVALFDIVIGLGAAGTYAGHVTGAYRDPDARFRPFGPITPGIFAIGAFIVLAGSAAILFGMMGIMTMIKGPPPH
jgi:hypothetical protein